MKQKTPGEMVMRIPAALSGWVAARSLSCHPCSLVQDTFFKLLLGPTSRKGQVSAAQGQSRCWAWCREHGGLPPLALESCQGPQLSFILVHPVRQGNMTFCPPGRPH